MHKQASVGSILESFSKFYSPKTAGDDSQGFHESPAPAAKVDEEAASALITPGTNVPNAVNSAGVDAGTAMSCCPANIPTEELVRKEQSVSAKIAAAPGSVEELVRRLSGNLLKIAGGETLTAQTVESVEASKVASVISEVNIDLLAQKTAAFLSATEFGYNKAKEVFAPQTKIAAPSLTLPEDIEARISSRVYELKTAGLNDQQIYAQLQADGQADAEILTKEAEVAENTRYNLASFVEQKIAAQLDAGTISSQQAEILLTDLGYETDTVKLASIEQAVDHKVASLRYQYPAITDEQIMEVLQKDAEADAAAMVDPNAMPPNEMVDPNAMYPDEMPPGEMPPGEMPPGEMPPGEMPPDAEEELAAQLQQAIAELQQAVEAGLMTEDQALQLLEESGLDVQGMLAAAGAALEAPVAEGAEALPADAYAVEEGAEKKEAALTDLIAAADRAYLAGSLTKAQANSMVAALKA